MCSLWLIDPAKLNPKRQQGFTIFPVEKGRGRKAKETLKSNTSSKFFIDSENFLISG